MFRTACANLCLGSSMLCVWGLACFMFRTCACCLFRGVVFFLRGTCSWFILVIHHALWLPAHTLHLGPVRALCSKPVYTLYGWDLCLLEDLGPVLASWLGPPVHSLCSRPVHTMVGTCACFRVWDLCLLHDLGPALASWLGPPVHTLLRLGSVHALYGWDSLCFASRFKTCACFMVETPCACYMFKTRTYCACFKSWDLCLLHSWDPPCLL